MRYSKNLGSLLLWWLTFQDLYKVLMKNSLEIGGKEKRAKAVLFQPYGKMKQ